ncbi:hypothetical protein T484DRAFT_1948042 [Baffinella frigidus]|nr:hypothetical protein T484DRAFT_1948042 [Cryptophyta sp. CCMP2293]
MWTTSTCGWSLPPPTRRLAGRAEFSASEFGAARAPAPPALPRRLHRRGMLAEGTPAHTPPRPAPGLDAFWMAGALGPRKRVLAERRCVTLRTALGGQITLLARVWKYLGWWRGVRAPMDWARLGTVLPRTIGTASESWKRGSWPHHQGGVGARQHSRGRTEPRSRSSCG